MNVWLAMLKKELRLQRGVAISILAVLVLLGSLALWLAFAKDGAISGMLLMFPLLLHTLFLPIYMLNSIQKEWKHTSSTFLQMPRPGWQLLLAKLVSGLIYFLISYTLLFAFGAIAIRLGIDGDLWQRIQDKIQNSPLNASAIFNQFWGLVGRAYVIGLAGLLYVNLGLVPIAALFSVLIQWMRGIVRNGAGFMTFLVFILSVWLLSWINATSLYQTLTHWGEFNFHLYTGHIGPFFTGDLLADLLVAVGLFLLSGWLLDRKVEV